MARLTEIFSRGINKNGKIFDILIDPDDSEKEDQQIGRSEQFSCGKPGEEHEFSSTQFNIDDAGYPRSQGSPLETLREMAKAIPDYDLAEDGREDEFHVTVLWGLK